MREHARSNPHRIRRPGCFRGPARAGAGFMCWSAILLGLAVLPAPALAQRGGHQAGRHDRYHQWDGRRDRASRDHHSRRWHDRRYREDFRDYRGRRDFRQQRQRFSPPRHLYRHQLRSYRPYYYGRVYYEPHGHYHPVYRFPMYLATGNVYRPYYYCGERLWGVGTFTAHGPQFELRIGFGR